LLEQRAVRNCDFELKSESVVVEPEEGDNDALVPSGLSIVQIGWPEGNDAQLGSGFASKSIVSPRHAGYKGPSS